MKLKNVLNKRNLVVLFFTVTLFLVLENPAISQINIYYSYTTISATAPQLNDGTFYQGSSIITQNTLTYVNQTTNEPVAYKTSFVIFNFGSLFLTFSPLIIYLYFIGNSAPKKKSTHKKKLHGELP